MKRILIISTIILLSLKTLGQTIDTAEYKNYKPCTESAEKWRNTTNSDYVPTGSQPRNNRNGSIADGAKNTGRRVGQFFAVLAGSVATVLIYKKIDDEIYK